MKRTCLFFGLVTLALSFFSCVEEINIKDGADKFQVDHSLALPLGKKKFEVKDFLDQIQELKTDENSNLYFVFADTALTEVPQIDLFKENKEGIKKSLEALDDIKVNEFLASSDPMQLLFGVNKNPNERRVDSLELATANLLLAISVTTQSDAKVDLSDLTVKLDFGSQFRTKDGKTTMSFELKKENPVNVSLSGGTVYFPRVNGKYLRGLRITPSVKSKKPIPNGAIIEIRLKPADEPFTYKTAYVYLGETTKFGTSKERDIELNLPKELADGKALFANPRVEMEIENGSGFEINLKLDELKAIKGLTEPIYAKFENDVISKDFTIKNASKPGEKSLTKFILDKKSGKIDELFAGDKLPERLRYKITTQIKVKQAGFLLSNDSVKIKLSAKVPLQISSKSSISMQDTIVDFSKMLKDVDFKETNVDKSFLQLKIMNAMPLEGAIKLQFLDKEGKEVSTTIEKEHEIASPALKDGAVDKTKLLEKRIKIDLSRQNWEELKKADKIIYTFDIKASSFAKEQEAVNIKGDDYFDVKLGIFLHLKKVIDEKTKKN